MQSVILCAFTIFLVACVRHSSCQQFDPEYAQVLEAVMGQNKKLLNKFFLARSAPCDRLIETTRVYIREYRRMRIRPLSLKIEYMSTLRKLLRDARVARRNPVWNAQCAQMLTYLLEGYIVPNPILRV